MGPDRIPPTNVYVICGRETLSSVDQVYRLLIGLLKGKVQMGNDVQTKLCWDQGALEYCSPEDHVWGWSVRASEVLHYDKDKLEDECLLKMLCQGLLNRQAGVKHDCVCSSTLFQDGR